MCGPILVKTCNKPRFGKLSRVRVHEYQYALDLTHMLERRPEANIFLPRENPLN